MGHAKDYENWARIVKDNSWGYHGVLPYFKSFENFEIPGDNGKGKDLKKEVIRTK